ncbi:MAG TPA: hypothetical protein VL550_05895 [Rhodocyclaceae bacterium]|nr:hypothetical protein [Rhodocyclaceae bacterium]
MTASDRFISIFDTLVESGWTPVKLFTDVVDGRAHTNKAVLERAAKHGIDVQLSPMTTADLQMLGAAGCETLIVGSYAHRIPAWEKYLRYAVNFHPSPLPFERGPNPALRAILNRWSHWAITCHKLTQHWDAGDILDHEPFPLTDNECRESLDLKLQMAGKSLTKRIAADLPLLWQTATPQAAGTYSPDGTSTERKLDFTQDIADILCRVRAFGLLETIATVNDVNFFVRRAIGWQQSHDYAPGKLILLSDQHMLISARDGFIGILEWSLVDPDANTGRIGR